MCRKRYIPEQIIYKFGALRHIAPKGFGQTWGHEINDPELSLQLALEMGREQHQGQLF